MSAVAHVSLELPHLPSYPEDVCPVVKIMAGLIDLVNTLEKNKSGGDKQQPQPMPVFSGSQPATGPTMVRPLHYMMTPALNSYYRGVALVHRPTAMVAAPLPPPIPAPRKFVQNGFSMELVACKPTTSLSQPLEKDSGAGDNISTSSSTVTTGFDLVQKPETENIPIARTSEITGSEGGEWLPLSTIFDTKRIFVPTGPRAKKPVMEPEQGENKFENEQETNSSNVQNATSSGASEPSTDSIIGVTELPLKNSQQNITNNPPEYSISNGSPELEIPVIDVPNIAPSNKVLKTDESATEVKKQKKQTRIVYGAPIKNRFEQLVGEIDMNPAMPGTSPDLSEGSNASSGHLDTSATISSVYVPSPSGSATPSEGFSNDPIFAIPHVPKKKTPRVSASPCSSVCSLDSLAALSDFGTSPARNTTPRPSPQLPSSVYDKLMEYLSTHFSAKSEEEIRRCLEAMRQEDRQVFRRMSLPDIVTVLNIKLGKRSCRRAVLQKFADLAWAPRPSGQPVSVPGTRLRREEGECSICFDPLGGDEAAVMTLKCSHIFHSECLQQWLTSDHTCPLCRDYVVTQEDFPELT